MASKPNTAQFFISYAREDKVFALKLRRGLATRGRLAWLDLKNIGALAPWRKEIAAAIDAADVLVFVLSPDSVTSRACRSELRFAVEAKKRIAPLVWRETDAKAVPPALQEPNWLFVRHREGLDDLVERLIKAADRDPDWIRDHSRLLTRAREWVQHRRDPSRLLNGQGLQDALRWLAESGRTGGRAVSRLHAEFIEASRVADAAETARQRELYRKALARQLAAQSELTRGSPEYAIETPALLAIESLRRWPTVEGDRALRRSLALVPRPPLARHVHNRDAAVAMSREGRAFAIAVRTVLRLVDTANGATVWRVRLGLRADRVAFGAGETTIVVRASHGMVQVHRSNDGVLLGRCRTGKDVDMLAVHPEGTAIAVVHSARPVTLEVWALGQDAPLFSVELEDKPTAIALFDRFLVAVAGPPSPMGHTRILAWTIGVKGPPRVLWELYGRPLHAAIAYDGAWVAVATIAFNSGRPNNISVGALAMRLANPEAAETMRQLVHDEPVNHFDAEGFERLVSFTHESTNVHVWEPGITRLVGRFRVRNQAYRAALADDGRFLVVAHRDAKALRSGGQVSLVTSAGEVLFTTEAKGLVQELACDAAGRIGVSTNGLVTLWDADTTSALRQFRAEQYTRLVFSADSTQLLVKAAENGSLVVPADRAKPVTHLSHTGSVWTQEFVGDAAEQVVSVGNPSYGTNPKGDPHVRLWDVARATSLALRRRIELAPIAITRDGRMATTATDGSVQIRRIADGRLHRRITSKAKVTELLFDADGINLAVVAQTSIEIWRVADGARAAMLTIQERQTLGAFDVARGLALLLGSYASSGSVVRLGDGRTIVDQVGRPHVDFRHGLLACIEEEKKIEVRQLNSEERPLMNAFHEGAVGVELAPDGAHLVSVGTDGSARIWQLADGAELARLEHPDRVLDGHFSPDSRLIATVCSDDIVRLWTWRGEDLIAEGQSRIPRRLTSAELDSFLPDPETRRM